MQDRTAGRAILWGWLICGVLDISSAIIISIANGGSPVRMLQGIAAALLGPASFDHGFATAAMGLAMHFGVALTATTIFYLLSRSLPAMVDWAVPSGILFGIFWLLVMYRGVVPLSQVVRTLYLSNVKRTLPDLWPLPFFVPVSPSPLLNTSRRIIRTPPCRKTRKESCVSQWSSSTTAKRRRLTSQCIRTSIRRPHGLDSTNLQLTRICHQ